MQYGVKPDDHRIDYDEVERLAKDTSPRDHHWRFSLSAAIDFERFREIADIPSMRISWSTWRISPAWSQQASIRARCRMLTSSPRHAQDLARSARRPEISNDEEIGKKINSAVFLGLQGGPLMHIIAAKAVAFREALQPSDKIDIQNVIENARRSVTPWCKVASPSSPAGPTRM